MERSIPSPRPRKHADSSVIGGCHAWTGRVGAATYLFGGRGNDAPRVPGRPDLEVAHLEQVHGTKLVRATSGLCGDGDALFVDQPGLALCIQTADCVPVLLAGPRSAVAIHAGWRGVAADIVASVLDQVADTQQYRAVIGPAIGLCCYEVGAEVADSVGSVLPDPEAIDRRQGRKPHLDLQLAVAQQLASCGVPVAEWVRECTMCDSRRLWSYRCQGASAGRNRAFVWLPGVS